MKIYGSRVDCVHTIAFQTLSGLSRSAQQQQVGRDPAGVELEPWGWPHAYCMHAHAGRLSSSVLQMGPGAWSVCMHASIAS